MRRVSESALHVQADVSSLELFACAALSQGRPAEPAGQPELCH